MKSIITTSLILLVISTYSLSQIVATHRQWDVQTIAPVGGVTEGGAQILLKRTTNMPDVNDGQTFSLGIFKSGKHKVLVDAGTGQEDLSFTVGYFVNAGEIFFHKAEKKGSHP